jgi:hypothetical protein
MLLGENLRPWLRFHNLAFNALNVALTGLLLSWIDRRPVRYVSGGFAAILFATLPYAYQAIPWINNFFYPLINLLLPLMTAVYWQVRLRNDRRLLIVALVLAGIAPFEIEYGAMGFCLLFIVEIIQWMQGRQARIWLWGPVLGLLMNTLFVLVWFNIPKESYFFGLPTPERVFQIISYLLQGIIYPLAPVAEWLQGALAISDIWAVWLVGLPGLLAIIVVALRSRRVAVLIAALLWFGALNLPALVYLTFDYVINSPRLLYPPGVALAWLWALCLTTPLLPRGPAKSGAGRWAAALFLLLLAVLPGMGFVEERLAHYALIEQPVQ